MKNKEKYNKMFTEDNKPLKENFYSLHRDLIKDKKITEVKAGELLYVQNGMVDWCVGEYIGDAHIVTMNWDQPGKRYKSCEYSVKVVIPLSKHLKVGSITNGFTSANDGYVSVFEGTIEDIKNESLTKQNNLKESSYDPFIDWETNKKARKEVLDWWADVEEWNAANDYPYNIENDTDDVGAMFTAIYDMANTLRKDAPELFKRGKAINNRYAVSQIREGVNSQKVYVVEPHKIDVDLYDIVFIDSRKKASSKRFESYEDAVKFIKKNAKYNNWIAGNKTDFQSKEDKLTDFGKSIKSSKINESLTEDIVPYGDVGNPAMLTSNQIKKFDKTGYEITYFKQNSTFSDADKQLKNIRNKFPDAKVAINTDTHKQQDRIYPSDMFIYYKKNNNTDESLKESKSFGLKKLLKENKMNMVPKEFTYTLHTGASSHDVTSYVIVIPNGLKTSDGFSMDAVVYAEDEQGNEINFSSFDEAQKWIDSYKDNLSFHVENRDELHATPIFDGHLTEDTIKQNKKWVNKGKEGTHGKFKTKKEADAQRKAMFANGYKEELKESTSCKLLYKRGNKSLWKSLDKFGNPDIFIVDDSVGKVIKHLQEYEFLNKKYGDILDVNDKEGLKEARTEGVKYDSKYLTQIDPIEFKDSVIEAVNDFKKDTSFKEYKRGGWQLSYDGMFAACSIALGNFDFYIDTHDVKHAHNIGNNNKYLIYCVDEDGITPIYAGYIYITSGIYGGYYIGLETLDDEKYCSMQIKGNSGKKEAYKEGLEEARTKRPNPENINILDSGYADNADDFKDIKKKQINKYKKDYPNVKCELIKSDTKGLKMWNTYTLKEDYVDDSFARRVRKTACPHCSNLTLNLIDYDHVICDECGSEYIADEGFKGIKLIPITNESLKEDYVDDFDVEDDEYDTEIYKGDDGCYYKEICHKMVYDYDGFTTDYTGYMKITPNGKENEVSFVFVFGDNELYRPEDGNYDYECSNVDEAFEWFDNYNGFDEDEDDDYDLELTSDDMNAGQWYESLKEGGEVKDRGHYYVTYVDFNSDDGKEHKKYFNSNKEAKKFIEDNDNINIAVKASNVSPIDESLTEASEKIHAVIKGEERPQVFVGGKVKPVRDTIDWFTCSSREEMCNELRDIYSDDYYDGCVVQVSGNGWTVDGKEFLAQNESINEAFVDGDDIEAFRKLKLGDKVKFSTNEMSLPPEVGEYFRVGPYTGTCIESNDDYVVMKVEHSSFGFNESLNESAGEVTQQDIEQAIKFAESDKGHTHPLIDLENRIIKIPFGSSTTEADLMSEGMLGDWFKNHGFNVSFEKGDYEYTTQGEWINRRAWTRTAPKKAYLRNRLIMVITWNSVLKEGVEVKDMAQKLVDAGILTKNQVNHTFNDKQIIDTYNKHFDKNGRQNRKSRYGKIKESSEKLSYQDKADIKQKIDTTDDSELIAAYVNSKTNKNNNNQTSVTESVDGKDNDAIIEVDEVEPTDFFPSDDEIDNFYFKNPDKNIIKHYMFDCFDLHTGDQNILFIGKGGNEDEAKLNAHISGRYEINDVYPGIYSEEGEHDMDLIQSQTSFTENLGNDATDIVKLIDKEFPEIEFVDERDLDNNQVGLIFSGASKVDAVDLGTYLDGLYVWYKIKGDKLLVKADEDANYLGEADNDLYDPYDAIDTEYDEEDVQ